MSEPVAASTGKSWAEQAEENDAAAAASSSVATQDAVAAVAKDLETKTDINAEAKEREVVIERHDGLDEPEDGKIVITGATEIYKAAQTFQELGLSPALLQGITAMKFVNPSKIQAQALPIILDKKRPNLWGQAHHGSGKTAAYSLSLLSAVDEKKQFPQGLVVCPVRELAIQVTDVINQLAQFTQVKAFAAVREERGAERAPITAQIVVGTAGTIIGQMKGKRWDARNIRMLVLDEADVMVDEHQGQAADSLTIKKLLPRDVQVLLFSATFPERVETFANKFAPSAVKIQIKTEQLSLDNITQFSVQCNGADHKYQTLELLFALLSMGATIIFVHTVATAKDLTNKLRKSGYKVSLLHGKDMSTKERDEVMEDFRKNRTNVLITTNVLARGVDVSHVTLVVNYEMPLDKYGRPDPETYIHRIGRSGRFGRKGVAINMLHDDKSRMQLKAIAQHFNRDVAELPVNNIEEIDKRVKAALQ